MYVFDDASCTVNNFSLVPTKEFDNYIVEDLPVIIDKVENGRPTTEQVSARIIRVMRTASWRTLATKEIVKVVVRRTIQESWIC